MTNPHKGDVSFTVSGTEYTLRYSHLALVKLEKLLDKSVVEVMRELEQSKENVRMGTVVALLWAGLQKHHSKMSFEDAADLLDEWEDGAAGAMAVIGEAFQRAFSAPGTKGTNPPLNGSAGTGMTSSLSTSATTMPLTPSGISRPVN